MPDDSGIDWLDAGRKFSAIQADMIHREESGLCGDAFYAEALRRLFQQLGHLWVTRAEMTYILEANRSVDRANGKAAHELLRARTEEYHDKLRDAARLCANALRARVNERTVPSAYRRQGWLAAADFLDPDTKCEHGWPLPHTSPGGGDPCPRCVQETRA